MMKKVFVSLFFLLYIFSSGINAEQLDKLKQKYQPKEIKIFYSDKLNLIQKSVTSKQMNDMSWIKIISNTPHRHLNPEKKEQSFQGIELNSLLPKVASKRIYIIGSDGYISVLPTELIKRFPIIIAFKENGKTINKRRGEQQIIFPTRTLKNGKISDKYLKKAAYWCWYVRSIVVDDLKISLKSISQQLPLKEALNKQLIDIKNPSIMKSNDYSCPEKMIFTFHKHFTQFESLSDFTNCEKRLADSIEIGIVANSKGLSLPIPCGGPYIALFKDKNNQYNPNAAIRGIISIK